MAKDKELAPAEEKAAKKEKTSKKQNGIVRWFKDLKSEWKKVVWPTKKTVFNNSVVVFTTMIVFAVFTFLLDTGFLKLLELVLKTKEG